MSSPDLDAFARRVRAFVEAHAPDSLRGTRKGRFDGFWGGRHAVATADELAWRDAMFSQGWTAPAWPREFGGGGLGKEEALVLDQELVRLRMPPPVVGFGLTMIGPTLLHYGTDEQRRRFLPPIVHGDIRWCQGYSEPGAGSDLASLQTRAVEDGDDFVVTGQKIWTSHANESDWIFCLVRTDPTAKKQAGITFLLIDLASPGVTSRPIRLLSGASPFCEVFFDEVRVPRANVVGRVNDGWTVAKALLGFERSMIGDAIGGQMAHAEGTLAGAARRVLDASTGPLPDALLRDAIAAVAMEERAFALTRERIRQAADAGRTPGPESSIVKVYGSELKQRRYELQMRILGPESVGWEGAPFAPDALEATREWLRSRANTIEGGSSEIQLNVIAQQVLGLPR
jgi:alkylation response protein AidB-like acyl-CoA dehydrogenase